MRDNKPAIYNLNDKKGRPRLYLFREEFNHFVQNDFAHHKEELAKITGKLSILIPLVVAILAAVLGMIVTIILVM